MYDGLVKNSAIMQGCDVPGDMPFPDRQ